MNLVVKRFTLRYRGTDYPQGTILQNVPDAEGADIIRIADGDVEEVKAVEVTLSGRAAPAPADEKAGSVAEAQAPAEAKLKEEEPAGLPPVNPQKTVVREKKR